VRWIEDRFEQLTANANCREHHYDITAYADRDGVILGVECDAVEDSGLFLLPLLRLPGGRADRLHPARPYRFMRFRCRTRSMATNSRHPALSRAWPAPASASPWRRWWMRCAEAGISPVEARLRNLVRPDEMPFTNVTNRHFDSGDYPEAVRRAAAALDAAGFPARKAAARAEGQAHRPRLRGVLRAGRARHQRLPRLGHPDGAGMEQCAARLSPDGVLELRLGAHSHGQGMEPPWRRWRTRCSGVHPDRVRLVHGDTAMTPYSTAPGAAAAR
jgi:carbon-monoxide dehydrogenase large subunit